VNIHPLGRVQVVFFLLLVEWLGQAVHVNLKPWNKLLKKDGTKYKKRTTAQEVKARCSQFETTTVQAYLIELLHLLHKL